MRDCSAPAESSLHFDPPPVGALDEVHVGPNGVVAPPPLQYWRLIRRKKFGHRGIEPDKVGNRTECPNSSDTCELTTTVRFGVRLRYPGTSRRQLPRPSRRPRRASVRSAFR